MVKLPQSGLCHVQAKAVSNGYAPPEAWGFSHAFCQTVPNSLQVILQLFFSKTNKMKFYLTKSAVYRSYLFEWVSESHSVVSDSLWPHGLYSPWNSPGQNTEVWVAFPFSRRSSQPIIIVPFHKYLLSLMYVWGGRSSGGRHGNLVFLPGESQGQRSLAGYSPQGCKESDTTEATEYVCTYVWRTPLETRW